MIKIEQLKDRYIIHISNNDKSLLYNDFSFPISKKQFLELYNLMDNEIKNELTKVLGVKF